MKIRVIHTFGRRAGEAQSLDKDRVRFGRAPDNDVIFDPTYDRDASSHHAEIVRESAGLVLVDLQSRHGTYLRGQRVTRQPIGSGDEITFGTNGPRVRIELEPSEARAPQASAHQVHAPQAHAPQAYAPQAHAPQAYAPQAYAPHAYAVKAHGPPLAGAYPQPPTPAGAYPQFPPPAGVYPQPPAPAGVYPPAPPAGKRVGQRTIAMMISSAVSAARGRSGHPSTQELSAYVEREVTAQTRGQQRTAYALGFLLILALASLGGLILWSSRSADDIDKLRGDLAKLPPDDPRRKEIEGRLGTLHPANASFGRNLYDRSKKSIFMLASSGQGFCTAFAVRPSVLATNAHCVLAARKHGGAIVALENEGRSEVGFAVTEMRAHPAYRDGDPNALTPDVGVVTIAGRAAVVLDLANAAELTNVGVGDDVYLIGFPGRLMDASHPAATFLAAHVGRITNAQGRLGAFAESWILQHDAATTPGTSGSPIWSSQGKVIGINAGGYLEGDDETIGGKKTEVVRASPYKFGMRIDLLDAILR